MFEFDDTLIFPETPPSCEDEHFHHHHHGEYPPRKPRYTFTEEMEATAREMRRTIDRLLSFEKRYSEKFEDMMKHLTSDNVIFKDTVANSYKEFLAVAKAEINNFENTVRNDYESLADEVAGYRGELLDLHNEFRDAVEDRLTKYNDNYVESFANYTEQVNLKISNLEQKYETAYTTFTENLNNTVNEFKSTWAEEINARLDGQDSVINDALLYMRTNFTDAVDDFLQEMVDGGEFDTIIQGRVFEDFNTRLTGLEGAYVTPKAYGAVADGTTDARAGLQQAITNNRVVDLGGEIYLITSPLTITAGTTIRNGTIIGSDLAYVLNAIASETYPDSAKNIVLENLTVQGSGNCAGGFLAKYGKNIVIRNCSFSGFYSETETTFGVHFDTCDYFEIVNMTMEHTYQFTFGC